MTGMVRVNQERMLKEWADRVKVEELRVVNICVGRSERHLVVMLSVIVVIFGISLVWFLVSNGNSVKFGKLFD